MYRFFIFYYLYFIFVYIFNKVVFKVICIYIYAFSRRFYPKRLTVHSCYTYFCQYMCSLGIEPTTFALLTQCSTTEPQEHAYMLFICVYEFNKFN